MSGLTDCHETKKRIHRLNMRHQIDGLAQEWHNSSALAMELCLSCANPSRYEQDITESYQANISCWHAVNSSCLIYFLMITWLHNIMILISWVGYRHYHFLMLLYSYSMWSMLKLHLKLLAFPRIGRNMCVFHHHYKSLELHYSQPRMPPEFRDSLKLI